MLNTLTIDDKVLSYNETLKLAKKIDPENFMDIAHDYLLDGGNLKSLKFKYRSAAINDYTQISGTSNTCNICNEVKPAACFNVVENLGSKYVANQCKDCLYKRSKEKYRIDPEFRAARFRYNKKWKQKKIQHCKEYHKNYWAEWSNKNAEYLKISRENYRRENKELLREKDRLRRSTEEYRVKRKQWEEENREYRKEYLKQWRKKNKDQPKKKYPSKKYSSEYYAKNAEEIKAKRRERYHLNKQKNHETTY